MFIVKDSSYSGNVDSIYSGNDSDTSDNKENQSRKINLNGHTTSSK